MKDKRRKAWDEQQRTVVAAATSALVAFDAAHPGVKALCDQFGGPLVSTSANRAGAPAARSLFDVRQRLGAELDYILPSTTGKLARPTEIRDLATLRVIRAG